MNVLIFSKIKFKFLFQDLEKVLKKRSQGFTKHRESTGIRMENGYHHGPMDNGMIQTRLNFLLRDNQKGNLIAERSY
jgi:hypothetical protein